MSVINKLEEIIEPFVVSQGMELVDIQYAKEHGSMVLRVFLDKENGIRLNDCETMGAKIDALIEQSKVIGDSYILEVSSPGLDRILKHEKDFVKFTGKEAKVTVYEPINGQRNFTGKIVAVSEGTVKINDVTVNRIIDIPVDKIARARLDPKL